MNKMTTIVENIPSRTGRTGPLAIAAHGGVLVSRLVSGAEAAAVLGGRPVDEDARDRLRGPGAGEGVEAGGGAVGGRGGRRGNRLELPAAPKQAHGPYVGARRPVPEPGRASDSEPARDRRARIQAGFRALRLRRT